jgi:glutathione S-transferase
VVLAEKHLPYVVVNVDLRKQEQKAPEFLKLNPYGKVPVLVDNGAVLYESCIINEYLDEKYPEPPLMPADPAKRAKVRILTDYGLGHLDASYQKLRMELMKEQKDQNAETIAAAKSSLRQLLAHLENELGEQPYLAGNFTLADAALTPRFIRLEGFGVLPDPALPRLRKYLQRIKERVSVKAIL